MWGAITLLMGLLCVLGAGFAVMGGLALRTLAAVNTAVVAPPALPATVPAVPPGQVAAEEPTTSPSTVPGVAVTTAPSTTLPATGPATVPSARVTVTQGTATVTVTPAALPIAAQSPVSMKVLMVVILGFALLYGLVGLGLCWLGIDTIRGRRWVRPAMLTLAGGMMVLAVSSIPSIVMTAAQALAEGVLLTRVFDLVAGLSFSLVFGLGIPLLAFRFFRGDGCVETLRHLNPGPSWMDAWPVAVFGLGAIVALLAGTQFVGFLLLGALVVSNVANIGWVVITWSGLVTLVSVSLGVATVVACFRSRWGRASAWPAWRFAVAWVVFGGAMALIPELFFPEISRLQESGFLQAMTPQDPELASASLPSRGYKVMATIASSVVLLVALWVLRGAFRSPRPVQA